MVVALDGRRRTGMPAVTIRLGVSETSADLSKLTLHTSDLEAHIVLNTRMIRTSFGTCSFGSQFVRPFRLWPQDERSLVHSKRRQLAPVNTHTNSVDADVQPFRSIGERQMFDWFVRSSFR